MRRIFSVWNMIQQTLSPSLKLSFIQPHPYIWSLAYQCLRKVQLTQLRLAPYLDIQHHKLAPPQPSILCQPVTPRSMPTLPTTPPAFLHYPWICLSAPLLVTVVVIGDISIDRRFLHSSHALRSQWYIYRCSNWIEYSSLRTGIWDAPQLQRHRWCLSGYSQVPGDKQPHKRTHRKEVIGCSAAFPGDVGVSAHIHSLTHRNCIVQNA